MFKVLRNPTLPSACDFYQAMHGQGDWLGLCTLWNDFDRGHQGRLLYGESKDVNNWTSGV